MPNKCPKNNHNQGFVSLLVFWVTSSHLATPRDCNVSTSNEDKPSSQYPKEVHKLLVDRSIPVTPPKFNSSPLKNDGLKITFLLGRLIFRGYVKLPGGRCFKMNIYFFLTVWVSRFPNGSFEGSPNSSLNDQKVLTSENFEENNQESTQSVPAFPAKKLNQSEPQCT